MEIAYKLNVFEGPLDLLLHLIEKNKVDIYDIPIVTITEQYLAYVSEMQEQDMDVMSEFLVMAGTLLQIKSKMLLPREETEEEEEEDPRAELVRRLLEYKMYKYAALELKDMELDASHNLYKKPTIPKEVEEYREEVDPAELVDGLTLSKLNDIFQSIMRKQVDKIDPIRSKFGTIEKEEINIEERMVQIREEVRGLKGINFRTLLETQPTRMNIIITFMSILELMKVGAITIRQEETFGEIVIDSLDEIEVTSESENRLEDEVTFDDNQDEAAVTEEENQELNSETGEE
ncbi:MAG TPA: segregation/condensation protein A [Lachnospiraceae bacterium]|nr:segregation/condensation protein A [Lachnospiraceae bacterium]